jgi:hypothetical protein
LEEVCFTHGPDLYLFWLCLWSAKTQIGLLKCIGFGLLTLYALGQCGLFCLLLYMQWVPIAIDFGALMGPYLILNMSVHWLIYLCIGPSCF